MEEKEITFDGRCDLCHRNHTACRNHHLIPQRLLKILPKNSYLRWRNQTIVICSKCNSYVHPENVLYRRINFLEAKCGFRITDYNKQNKGDNNGRNEEPTQPTE